MPLEWSNKVELQKADCGKVAYYIQQTEHGIPPVRCWYEISEKSLESSVYLGSSIEEAKVYAENHYNRVFKGKI